MTRDTPAPRAATLGAAQTGLAGKAGRADAVAASNYTTAVSPVIPQSICPRCAYAGLHTTGPGAGPHYARLLCGQCDAFLRWLPKPRPVAQEVQHD